MTVTRILRTLTVGILCTAFLLSASACAPKKPLVEAESTADLPYETHTAESETLSPEEQLTADRQAYLDTVSYRTFVLTGEEEPYFVGRWFDKTLDGVSHKVSLTDGAHLYFLIENAASFDVSFTRITFGEVPYFAYSIDGGEPVRQPITDPTVALPDTERHTVRVIMDSTDSMPYKWDLELGYALKSVTPAEGGSLLGIQPTERVIYFYGDSITQGANSLGLDFTSHSNSVTHTYAWQCAEALGATPHLVGYSGSGITSAGTFHILLAAIDCLSQTRPTEDALPPDAIVINHGANDSGVTGREFMEALEPALARLREKYPDTPIIYLIPFHQTHAAAIKKTMKGMDHAYVVETADWKLTYTDGAHPDTAGAKLAGERLAEEMKKILGEDFFS